MNREQWLTELGKKIEVIFRGFTVAPYRVSCSWPVGNPWKILGQCLSNKHSPANVHEIAISPLSTTYEAANTLCHEMAHIIAGTEAAHGKEFVRVCDHAGITSGKAKTRVPGTELKLKLKEWIQDLGEYPHKGVIPLKEKKTVKPTSIKLTCVECECEVRISLKWLDEAGPPTCACGGEMVNGE